MTRPPCPKCGGRSVVAVSKPSDGYRRRFYCKRDGCADAPTFTREQGERAETLRAKGWRVEDLEDDPLYLKMWVRGI